MSGLEDQVVYKADQAAEITNNHQNMNVKMEVKVWWSAASIGSLSTFIENWKFVLTQSFDDTDAFRYRKSGVSFSISNMLKFYR